MSDSVRTPDDFDELFWRDEVLEAMYWMIGEGIETAVSPVDLRGFLDAPSNEVELTFAGLDDSGFVRDTDQGYVFTGRGEQEAKRRFADEFADIKGFDTSHNDCSADCWCHDPDHAEEECPSDHAHEHVH